MIHRKVLIVDDESNSLQTIVMTLNDAELPYTTVDSTDAGWNAFQEDPAITLVLARALGQTISGIELCRRIREVKSHADLPIMIVLREDELPKGADALLSGASDLLIEPFEPRELRMRAGIVPSDQLRRVDEPHTLQVDDPAGAGEPAVYVPEFDAKTKRLDFGPLEERVGQWENDPDVTRISLDKVIVCPECEAIPTFRPGCGACGSAWVEQEVLIHHYACAHVGPEDEFLTPAGMVCPKCRLRDLVAGSDFEQIRGCLRCSDCDAVFTQTKMIGHCLSCQHRFAADDGELQFVYGYRVGRAPNSAVIAAPTYHNAGIRESRTAREIL